MSNRKPLSVGVRLLKVGAMPATRAIPDLIAVASVYPLFAAVTVIAELPPSVRPDTVTTDPDRDTVAPFVVASE